jgi:hypothetical protein
VITNGYATLLDVKAALHVGPAVTADDALIELAIESASRLIDEDCNRVFYASGTGVTRAYAPRDWMRVDTDDLISISAVDVDTDHDGVYETSWGTADYRTAPANGISGGRPWPTTALLAIADKRFYPYGEELTVRVTGNFGFGTAVPTAIKQATVLQASRIYKRNDSPLGVAGFGDMGAIRVSRTDPDVFALVKGYRRSPIAVA